MTFSPSRTPSKLPTRVPTRAPTIGPTIQPTKPKSSDVPSFQPSTRPTNQPLPEPVPQPSFMPSPSPVSQQKLMPIGNPSAQPSSPHKLIDPVLTPSSDTVQETRGPSAQPTMLHFVEIVPPTVSSDLSDKNSHISLILPCYCYRSFFLEQASSLHRCSHHFVADAVIFTVFPVGIRVNVPIVGSMRHFRIMCTWSSIAGG